MQYQILALGGDGIGPEVLDSGIQIIKYISKIEEINIKIEYGLIVAFVGINIKHFA